MLYLILWRSESIFSWRNCTGRYYYHGRSQKKANYDIEYTGFQCLGLTIPDFIKKCIWPLLSYYFIFKGSRIHQSWPYRDADYIDKAKSLGNAFEFDNSPRCPFLHRYSMAANSAFWVGPQISNKARCMFQIQVNKVIICRWRISFYLNIRMEIIKLKADVSKNVTTGTQRARSGKGPGKNQYEAKETAFMVWTVFLQLNLAI